MIESKENFICFVASLDTQIRLPSKPTIEHAILALRERETVCL